MAERRKKEHDSDTVRPEQGSVGETLRSARLARKLELEDVSVSIHIRQSQLRAIEENDLSGLPGMTYAVGFVRSYANFLGLNGADIVHRFKAENGYAPVPAKLAFPEPIVESRVPDPMMIGVGAFLAVVILVVWTIYTNMHGGVESEIPSTPEVAAIEAPAENMTPMPEAEGSLSSPAALSTPAPTESAPASSETATAAPSVAASPAAPEPVKTETVKAEPAKEEPVKTEPVKAEPEKAAASSEKKDEEGVINVKKGKSRITLKATQPSWVQVSDNDGTVLYRKVLRPGEQYAVPDEPGLTLDTANAGGLDVTVDGKSMPSLGATGEILRGASLEPKRLKVQRVRLNN